MTDDDDDYVDQYFVGLEALAKAEGIETETLRRLVLAGLLPLPSYLRSDGTEMVPRDWLALAQQAGGVEHLPTWFGTQFDDPAMARQAWEDYLSGQYVCLREISPTAIKRKHELCSEITSVIGNPRPDSAEWLDSLHELVDELDALEPPFAPYDRLRFGGPLSRDQLITDVRRRFPVRAA